MGTFGSEEFTALQTLAEALSGMDHEKAQSLLTEAAEFLRECDTKSGTSPQCAALTFMQTHFLFADYPFISLGCARQLYRSFRNPDISESEKKQRLGTLVRLEATPPQMLSRLKHALYMPPSQQGGRPVTTKPPQSRL